MALSMARQTTLQMETGQWFSKTM